jgi:hypothetical protein
LLIASAFFIASLPGTSLARDARVEAPGDQPSGPVRGVVNVIVVDAQNGAPIQGAHGALYTISLQGERPTALAMAISGRTGMMYFRNSNRRGDVIELVVSASGYQPNSQFVFIGAGAATVVEAVLSPVATSGSGGKSPLGAPGHVPTTWGGIKALY